MRVLLDTNILLDYLVDREPYSTFAEQIMEACVNQKISGCISAHSIPDMFYILRKNFSQEERREWLLALCQVLDVIGLERDTLIEALENKEFTDFEDCIQSLNAMRGQADVIITRNIKDFECSLISCISPDEFVKNFLIGRSETE